MAIADAISEVHPELASTLAKAEGRLPEAPPEEKTLRAGQLGELVGLGKNRGAKVNKLLQELGYQHSVRTQKGRLDWHATDKGQPHSQRRLDKKSNGTSVESLVWKESILPILREHVTDKITPDC